MEQYEKIISTILKDKTSKKSYLIPLVPADMLWMLSEHPNICIRMCAANLIDFNQLPRLLNDPDVVPIVERRFKFSVPH